MTGLFYRMLTDITNALPHSCSLISIQNAGNTLKKLKIQSVHARAKMNITGLSGPYWLGFQIVAIGHINGVAQSAVVVYQKVYRYGHLPRQKDPSGLINNVTIFNR